jgi:RimJ/RimL family protein N-acetyltransferase
VDQDRFGTVETGRLLLRPFTAADADDLAALHGDPLVMRRIDDGRPVERSVVLGETLPAILRAAGDPHGTRWWAAIERASGAFTGWFALGPARSVGLDGGTELGYRLRPAFWGRGYATEGARALLSTAFTGLAADRVVATTMTVNAASRRVLEKAGLRLTRTFFADWPDPIEGAEHGDVVYELLREEWLRRG